MTSPNPSAADFKKAVEALRGGNKLEAIKLLRASADVGLREAKAMAEKLEKEMPRGLPSVGAPPPHLTPHRHTGLAPGEVPHTGSAGKWFGLAVVVLVAFAAAYFLGYIH